MEGNRNVIARDKVPKQSQKEDCFVLARNDDRLAIHPPMDNGFWFCLPEVYR